MVNAKTKPQRRSGLKGAVLIMVITVMFVLIIMLAGAMAIVSTASNRAYTQFEESQAYYTARSGLEIFVDSLWNDSAFVDQQVKSDGKGNYTLTMSNQNDGDSSKTANDVTKSGAVTQGRVLQEAIFGKLCDDGSGNYYYDVSESLYPYDGESKYDYIHYNTTDGSTTEKKGQSYKKDDIDRSYMTFGVKSLVNFAEATGTTNGLLANNADGSVYIEVQLRDLKYSIGADDFDRRQLTSTSGTKKTPILSGNDGDGFISSYEVLVTCTAEYNGESATVSQLLVKPYSKTQTSDGFASVGTSSANNSDFYGGMSMAGDITWTNDGQVYDNVFVTGDANMGSTKKEFVLGTGQSMFINGDFTGDNGMVVTPITLGDDKYDDTTAPYVYVGGTIKSGSGNPIKIGTKDKNVTVVCSGLEFKNAITIYGDTYIDGALKIDGSTINFNGIDTIFNGDLYISDRDDQSSFDSSFPNRDNTVQYCDVVYKTVDYSKMVNNGGFMEKLLKDIAAYGGKSFCTGDIYFYYSEIDAVNDNFIDYNYNLRETEGCTAFGMLYRLLENVYNELTVNGASNVTYGNVQFVSGSAANVKSFLDRMHPIGYYSSGVPNAINGGSSIEGFDADYDLRVANIKYLVALPTDAALVSEQIEYDSSAKCYVFKDGAETETITINLTLPYKPYDSGTSTWDKLTERVMDKAGAGGKNLTPEEFSDKKNVKNAKVLTVDTMIGKYYKYAAVYDGTQTGIKGKVNEGDFLNGTYNVANGEITRDGEMEMKCKSGFSYNSVLDTYSTVMSAQTWDTYFEQIVTAYSKFVGVGKCDTNTFGINEYADTMLEVFNSVYAYSFLTNSYETPSERNGFNATSERQKHNVSFMTIEEKIQYDTGVKVDVSTLTPYAWTNGTNEVSATDLDDGILYLAPGSYNGRLVIKGDQYVNIVFTKGDYTFSNFGIITDDFVALDKGNIHAGQTGEGSAAKLYGYTTISAPNIRWYIQDGADLNFSNQGDILMGYAYGPLATVAMSASNRTQKGFIYHCNSDYTANRNGERLGYIGSLFVGAADIPNTFGLLYVDPVDGVTDYGSIVSNNTAKYGGVGTGMTVKKS